MGVGSGNSNLVYMSQWGAHFGVLTDAALLDSNGNPKLFPTVIENSLENIEGIEQYNMLNNDGFGMFNSAEFLSDPLILDREDLINELTNEWLTSEDRFSPYCDEEE